MVGSTYGYFNKNSFIPVGSKSGKYKVLVELNDANKIVVTDHPIFSDTSDNFFTINLNNN
jgi:nitrous oxide reductase